MLRGSPCAYLGVWENLFQHLLHCKSTVAVGFKVLELVLSEGSAAEISAAEIIVEQDIHLVGSIHSFVGSQN